MIPNYSQHGHHDLEAPVKKTSIREKLTWKEEESTVTIHATGRLVKELEGHLN